MKRIDLNMTVKEWLNEPSPSARMYNVLCSVSDGDKILRDFLKQEPHCLLGYSLVGKQTLAEFLEVLAYYGLRMGMTDEELAEYESEDARESVIMWDEPEYGERKKPDTINWEQRRWELAKYLYELDYDTSTPAKCIKKADKYIEEYKKSLNKEE